MLILRSRSVSPETYRKYGSRTPSPRRKSRRSRSRSPIVRKSKPLKPNKPKVKNQKSEESESSSSSSSDEEMTPPSSPKVEKKLVIKTFQTLPKTQTGPVRIQTRNGPKPDPNQAQTQSKFGQTAPNSSFRKKSKNAKYKNYVITRQFKAENQNRWYENGQAAATK